VFDGIKPPLARQALKFSHTSILKSDARAGDKVLNRARDDNLTGPSLRRYSGADMNCDASNFAVDELALAGVEPGTYLQPEFPSSSSACRVGALGTVGGQSAYPPVERPAIFTDCDGIAVKVPAQRPSH
jgi:hypothetical protein